MPISDVPRRTMLSRVTDHHLEVLANRVPIAFEAEFINKAGENTLYRGILLPFSDDNNNINFILGGVRWILEKDVTLDDTKPTIEELMRTISDSNDNKPIEVHAEQAIVDPIDADISEQPASDLGPVIEQDDFEIDNEIEVTPEHIDEIETLYPEDTSKTESGLVRKEFIPIEDDPTHDIEKTEPPVYNEVHAQPDEPEEVSTAVEEDIKSEDNLDETIIDDEVDIEIEAPVHNEAHIQPDEPIVDASAADETDITSEDDLGETAIDDEIDIEIEAPVHNEVHIQPDEPMVDENAAEETEITSEDDLGETAIDDEIDIEIESPVHNEVHIQPDEPIVDASAAEETEITSEDNLDETTILDKIDLETENSIDNNVHVQPDTHEEDTSIAEETDVTFENYLDKTLSATELDLETELSVESVPHAHPDEPMEDARATEEINLALEEEEFFEIDIPPSSKTVDELDTITETATIESLLKNADDTEEEFDLAHSEEILEEQQQIISPVEIEEPLAEKSMEIDNVHETIANDDDLSIEELMQSIISDRKFDISNEHEEPPQDDFEKLAIESNTAELENDPLEEDALEENDVVEDGTFNEITFIDDTPTEARAEEDNKLEDNILVEEIVTEEITAIESVAETTTPEITDTPKAKPKRTSVIERAMEMMSPSFGVTAPVVVEDPQIVGSIEINEEEGEAPLQNTIIEDVIETPELAETMESPEIIEVPEIVEAEVTQFDTDETYIDETVIDPIEEMVKELISVPPLETQEVETEEDHSPDEEDEFVGSVPSVVELKANLKQIIGYIKKEDANHNRSRDSLYNILTAIYEFHDTCEKSPDAFGEIVDEYDLKIQSRAPFTPVLKICLGKDYDKTRLTEYAAALGIARYMNVEINEFHAFIKNFPGGIKGCVKEMRIIRKHGASGHITARKTRSVEEARKILREMAPIASFRLKKIIVGNNVDEFCLLLARRDGHEISVLKILDDKYSKIDPVLKRTAFIKGNLNDRK